jgi:hypothetical protein
MLFWTFQITLISIILIFLVHHLISFFKTTLTVPKIKDLINVPAQKYESMFQTISHSSSSSSSSNNTYDFSKDYTGDASTNINLKPDTSVMKNELKNFLKNQLKGEPSNKPSSQNNFTDISTLDSFSSGNYSAF